MSVCYVEWEQGWKVPDRNVPPGKVFMATLQESNLSSNLGISFDAPPADALPVALFRFNNSDIFHLHDRQASVFHVTDPERLMPDEKHLDLPKPWRTTLCFAAPPKLYGLSLFKEEYVLFDEPQGLTRAVMWRQSPEIESPEDLSLLIKSHERGREWPPSVALIGERAIVGLLSSTFQTLGATGEGNDPFDTESYPLSLVDHLTMRFIQLADMCGVDIKRFIPPGHFDFVLNAMVVTTFVDHYSSLNTEQRVGRVDGNWRYSFARFARAYGVSSGEVADVVAIRSDQIYDAAKTKLGKPLEPMQEDVFRLAAEYVVGERP
jgi:hypothetical protein